MKMELKSWLSRTAGILTLALAGVILMAVTASAAMTLPDTILTVGSQGDEVEAVQRALNTLGYELTEDGIYGPITRWAVRDFQSRQDGLATDGIYGPRTRTHMLSALGEQETGDDEGENGEEEADTEETLIDYIQEGLEEDRLLTVGQELVGKQGLVPQAVMSEHHSELRVAAEDYDIDTELFTQLPEGLTKELAYDKYPIAYDYFLVTTNVLNVRAEPTTEAPIVHRLNYYDKVNAVQVVKGQYLEPYGSHLWYRVVWHTGDRIEMGFVFGALGQERRFRLDEMFSQVLTLQETLERGKNGYIFNYRHIHGMAPAHQGSNEDAFGESRNQSAPGYVDLERSNFRYFPDGLFVTILEEEEDHYLVTTPSFSGEYWIPRRYVSSNYVPKVLRQVVVVDDINQNQAAFAWVDEEWHLISYTYATTGTREGPHHFATPKGHFMAIERRPFFWYFTPGTWDISGFAPYTVRFSGGGYIHGVPVELGEGQTAQDVNPNDPKNHEEFLFTIGTTPRSRKCVRNFTSHAKFLYDWLEIGEAAVIVIE